MLNIKLYFNIIQVKAGTNKQFLRQPEGQAVLLFFIEKCTCFKNFTDVWAAAALRAHSVDRYVEIPATRKILKHTACVCSVAGFLKPISCYLSEEAERSPGFVPADSC